MTTDYSIADMMIGVRNMIEAAGLRAGDQVLLLADTRSDKPTVEALNAGLRFFGAEPMILVTEPIARYGDVPQAVLEAMRAEFVALPVPADYAKYFDYNIVKKIYRELKSSGWKSSP